MTTQTVHRFAVETSPDGYGALETRGADIIYTHGATLDELLKNIGEALEAYYSESDTVPAYEIELAGLVPA